MLPQELGLGRGELAIGQRALLVQRSQRLELGRNPLFYHFTNNLCFIGVAGSWMLIISSVA